MTMQIESRKHKRYLSRDGILAAFCAPDQDRSIKVGQIIDMSKSGLAFRYLAEGEQTGELAELTIVASTGPLLQLEKIPCAVVYDSEIGDEPGSALMARRCGVRFAELPEDQLYRLNWFIQNYTSGEV